MHSDAEIRVAIRDLRLVEFHYGGDRRVVEPHVLGTRKGVQQLLAFQVSGTSRGGPLPDWRCFDFQKISGFRVLSETLAGREMMIGSEIQTSIRTRGCAPIADSVGRGSAARNTSVAAAPPSAACPAGTPGGVRKPFRTLGAKVAHMIVSRC